ncbi:cysteine desulfurase [Thioalkalivibrio paradoxus ARh 1]|uniref:cysteine desulfurase n=2 Tax=Thioalkalivibrio paradoxus TaxID=108010 RepID=W0DRL3_9GAMM|nr:cysteine desulfurase [Thioalkalivibrio paradoxus ARh 1]
MRRIYLDHNASTPIAAPVARVMQDLIRDAFGNPSSPHWAGRPARAAVETGRRQVAELLGCAPEEIVFTSGGSEANNLALKGLYFARRPTRAQIITTAVEHPAITEPCRFLESLGVRIVRLPVDPTGRIDPEDLRCAITTDTLLVSVMHANNEVGSVQPIAECAAIAREHGVPFHTDAAQSVGKIATRVDDLGVDLLSVAGHKFQAPKGVGALYLRTGTALEPLIHGAGHERGLRAGTESALLAAALGAAAELARDLEPIERVRELRDRLRDSLAAAMGERVVFHGARDAMLPNTLSVSFAGVTGSEVLAALDGVAASTGSACHSGVIELSPVLRAMGVPPEIGQGTVRFSLGRDTTDDEITEVAERLIREPWKTRHAGELRNRPDGRTAVR